MKPEYQQLAGEMIALARITDGNEHLINPDSTALLRKCLEDMDAGCADTEELIRRIGEEKRKMVPDCFLCANPCGKTFPFDLEEIPEGQVRELKLAILDALCRNPQVREELLYLSLTVIGLSGYEREDLVPILEKIG